VVYYDRVLVLDQGQVVEYAPPLALLEDEGSRFRSMADRTGEVENLLAIAREAAREKTQPGS